MKKILSVLTIAALLAVTAGFSYASGRYDDRPWRHGPRHDDAGYSVGGNYSGITISFSFPGTYYRPHRRHYRPVRRVWVPGHWDYVKVWIPGRVERHWSPGHRDPYGYRPGHFEERRHDDGYRMKKVWREGRYR